MVKRIAENNTSRFTYETEIVPVQYNMASILSTEFTPDSKEAHWEIDGTWFKKPNQYPCTLFDMNGYVVLEREPVGRYMVVKTSLNVNNGIHTLTSYKRYPHMIPVLENYLDLVGKATAAKRKQDKLNWEKQKSTSPMIKLMQSMLNKSKV